MKQWPVPEVGRKTRYLSPEEFHRVIAYLDPDRAVGIVSSSASHRAARTEIRDLVITLAYTGGRWSEIAKLRWDQVDLAAGTIKLWAGEVQRERVVPISDPFRAVLARRLPGAGAVPWVFPGPGGRPRAQPTKAIGLAMDACGLNPPDMVERHGRATIHSLRHTFATWLIQNGADLGEVSHALGHANLNMTQRYAHLSKSATLAKLGGILNGVRVHDMQRVHAESGADISEDV
jgi:integrase